MYYNRNRTYVIFEIKYFSMRLRKSSFRFKRYDKIDWILNTDFKKHTRQWLYLVKNYSVLRRRFCSCCCCLNCCWIRLCALGTTRVCVYHIDCWRGQPAALSLYTITTIWRFTRGNKSDENRTITIMTIRCVLCLIIWLLFFNAR